MSMILSKKWTAVETVLPSNSQFILPPSTILERLIEPRLHDSYASNGCSPQGFVASIGLICAVALCLFISSMNISPGSPHFHAFDTIRSNILRASSLRTALPVRGFISSYSLPSLTFRMNSSVTATERLKFRSPLP